MSEAVPPKGFLKKFFANPLVGIIGSIASVVSLFLAIYFYIDGREFRQLAYSVNPVKTVILKSGQASRLTASFDNNVIDTDITAAQVAIWNQGKLSVRKENVLKPIIIYTDSNTPILEATIRKNSREVTQLMLNSDELQKGRATISWNIFEQNDGGVIQLIYAGSPKVDIHVDGVIEGQGQIVRLGGTLKEQEDIGILFKPQTWETTRTLFIYTLVVLIITSFVYLITVKLGYSYPLTSRLLIFFWGSFIIIFIFARTIYFAASKADNSPPFGF